MGVFKKAADKVDQFIREEIDQKREAGKKGKN